MKDIISVMNDKSKSEGFDVIKEYRKTFSNNPDGSDKKGDLIVPSPKEALPLLKELVEQTKSNAKKESKRNKWNFEKSPHKQFDKTLDDTFMAFIMWARVKKVYNKKDKDISADLTVGNEINVSKAFRRLESYAEWMESTGSDLIEPPLTPMSVKNGLDAWNMTTSFHNDGTFIWWSDISKIDVEYIKKELTPEDSLRAFVWYSHYIMYNEKAQQHGIMSVLSADNMGLMESLTFMPMSVTSKMDRFTIGVLPVKMKNMYCTDCARWVKIMMKIFGMFMSKKMKKRIKLLDDRKELVDIFGKEVIPKGFGNVEGSFTVDPMKEEFFSS